MSNTIHFKKIQDKIDSEKVKAQGKRKSHHLTRITGLPGPMEYVVCTDGTELPYTKTEEQDLIKARMEELAESQE